MSASIWVRNRKMRTRFEVSVDEIDTMSIKGIIGAVVAFAAFACVVGYANLSLMRLNHDLDLTEGERDNCIDEKTEAERNLRHALRDRDLALMRAEDAERLMRSSTAQTAQEAFARLRAEDARKALATETARLKASIAALKAAAIETGSIGKVPAAAAPAPVKRKSPARNLTARDDVHEWFNWATPKP
jgi:hypothetical protein